MYCLWQINDGYGVIKVRQPKYLKLWKDWDYSFKKKSKH